MTSFVKLLSLLLSFVGAILSAPVREQWEHGTNMTGILFSGARCQSEPDEFLYVDIRECTAVDSTQSFHGLVEGFCIMYHDDKCTARYYRAPAHACHTGLHARSIQCLHEESTWEYKWRNIWKWVKNWGRKGREDHVPE